MGQHALMLHKHYSLKLLDGILPHIDFQIIIRNTEGCVFPILFQSLSTAALHDYIKQNIHIPFPESSYKCTEESSFRIVVIKFSQRASCNGIGKTFLCSRNR